MEAKELSLREWAERYKAGAFKGRDVHTQISAGWYDWFCSDKALASRLRSLAPKVLALIRFLDENGVDIDKLYVFFKNNCPMVGGTYDSFSFCDRETGDVCFWFSPVRKEIASRKDDFHGVTFESWRAAYEWFCSEIKSYKYPELLFSRKDR